MVKCDSEPYTLCFLWALTGLHIQMYRSNNSKAYGRSSVCIGGWWFSVFIYHTNVLTHWKENDFRWNVTNGMICYMLNLSLRLAWYYKTKRYYCVFRFTFSTQYAPIHTFPVFNTSEIIITSRKIDIPRTSAHFDDGSSRWRILIILKLLGK